MATHWDLAKRRSKCRLGRTRRPCFRAGLAVLPVDFNVLSGHCSWYPACGGGCSGCDVILLAFFGVLRVSQPNLFVRVLRHEERYRNLRCRDKSRLTNANMRTRVLVQPVALPRFWIFVYRVSPLTYFLKGMVLASFKGTHLHCSATQLLHIDPIKDRSSPLACGEYLEPYIQLAGGYVENPTATSDCRYCPVFETDRALRDILGMDTDDPWRNAAYMAVYIAFNVLATFVLYWVARVPRRKVGTSA